MCEVYMCTGILKPSTETRHGVFSMCIKKRRGGSLGMRIRVASSLIHSPGCDHWSEHKSVDSHNVGGFIIVVYVAHLWWQGIPSLIYFNHILITGSSSYLAFVLLLLQSLDPPLSAIPSASSGLESLDHDLFIRSWQLSPACSVVLTAGLSSPTMITPLDWAFCFTELLGLVFVPPGLLACLSSKLVIVSWLESLCLKEDFLPRSVELSLLPGERRGRFEGGNLADIPAPRVFVFSER